jgi:hypothetical protein
VIERRIRTTPCFHSLVKQQPRASASLRLVDGEASKTCRTYPVAWRSD